MVDELMLRDMNVDRAEIDRALNETDKDLRKALEKAAERINAYHRMQKRGPVEKGPTGSTRYGTPKICSVSK